MNFFKDQIRIIKVYHLVCHYIEYLMF
ncbi:Protein of unknown function [Lactobacillus helveticus CIRM-BIA 953]|uniref:Uncharacterized protein n=1 Tax=Lactobacillus helveticus CIRM-BIA 953 TaxID=1226335 RepID=U4QEQ0_LACHE|nr:Protein of unknown function [Lactobacillus helveticus CIRM-BIA 953]